MGMAAGGSGGKSGDIRAGGAFVEISAKDQLTKVLVGLKAKALAFGKGLKEVGKGAMWLGGAASAPFALLAKGGVDRAEEISNLSHELGYSIDEMQRLKYAADVAGVSIDEITKNPGRFKDLLSEAPLMDADTIKESVEANRAWRKTLIELQNAMVPLATSLNPILKGVVEFAKNNGPLIRTVALVAGGIFILGAVLFAAGTVITTVVGGITALITVVTTVISVVGGAAAAVGGFIPLLAIVVGTILTLALVIGTAYAAFKIFTTVFPETWKAAKQFFGDLFDIASDSVGGVVDAIMNGDLEGAWNIAIKGGLVAWRRFELAITQIWVRIKSTIVDTWEDVMLGMKLTLIDFTAWLMRNDPTGLLNKSNKSDADINGARDQLQADAAADRVKRQEEANKFREQQISDAERGVLEARQQLKDLIAKQQKPAAMAGAAEDFTGRISAVRGAFRRLDLGGQQFGSSKIASDQRELAKAALVVEKDQLDQLKQLNKNLKLK